MWRTGKTCNIDVTEKKEEEEDGFLRRVEEECGSRKKVKNASMGFFFLPKSSGSVLQWMHLTEREPQSQQDVVPLTGN